MFARHNLGRSWIELGAQREGLLQMLDEDANLGGHLAAGRSHRKDGHRSLIGREKTENSAFSEFCREKPSRRLCNP